MAAKRISWKFLKIAGIIVGSFLVLLTAFHFWFVHHAEEILQQLVASKSRGKIKLEVSNFKFNWFSKKMELEDAVLLTTDTANAATTYRFQIKKVKLSVKAVYPLLFEDKVLINKLSLKDPDIIVTRLRASKDSLRSDKVSVPQEMGRIYNSIQDALQVLQVNKFEIENATFTLINRIRPEQLPVTIGRIDFHIDNLKVDTSELTGKEKIFFSDNVVLKSRDQVINFPDRRHQLSYRKFRINIEKKIVEFDSCTIAALRTDSSANDFSIFFDELVMTNIDFDTLYRAEVIKADSVYCTNPQFKLNVDLAKRKGKSRTRPKLDEIIRQMTGDLMLNFVVVNNASFDINTITREGRNNSFTSNGNNFEMQGLLVDNDALRPLRVKKFSMAIRNYENFLRDSTYEMQFDSVHFADDKIYLNDFRFRKVLQGKTINSFLVPRFYLSGLSWEDLLFEQKLLAQQATLYNPVILFTESSNKAKKKKQSLFDVLASVSDVIMLEDLTIQQGQIEIHLNGGNTINLQDANLSVESRRLLGSDELSSIRRSVNFLDLKKGIFRINGVLIRLDDIKYKGEESRLNAGSALLSNDNNTLHAVAKGVIMNEIFINEYTGDVSIGNVSWKEAEINVDGLSLSPTRKQASFVSLTDIDGGKTKFRLSSGNKHIQADLEKVKAVAIVMKPGEKPIVAGLQLEGKGLHSSTGGSLLTSSAFTIEDLRKASFINFHYKQKNDVDSTDIFIPQLEFVPDVQTAIGGSIKLGETSINQPVINIYKIAGGIVNKFRLPIGTITKLTITQPQLNYTVQRKDGVSQVHWFGKNSKANAIVLFDLNTTDSSADIRQLLLSLRDFSYSNTAGRGFDAGKGEVTALLNNVHVSRNTEGENTWKGQLASLDANNFFLDSIGKKGGRLDLHSIQLRDLEISSASLWDARKIISENTGFRVQNLTGSYLDKDNHFDWNNAYYDKSKKTLTIDSFSYKPAQPLEAFVASRPYQSDYFQINTGKVEVGPFDIDQYLKDSIFRVGKIRFDKVQFDDFRDNRPPFRSGIIKPLMVNRIKSIPVKIWVDTVVYNNANVTYAELNPKTNQTGIIQFNRMILKFFPVRNFDFSPTDSLRIHANGYLMDSIWVRLRLKESYTDSLSGFLFTLRMKPGDMRVLNPVLYPLASAKLKSGYLDTLSMRVAGTDYLAYGEMKLYYHDLSVQIYKNGDGTKRGFLSFLANSFIIRNKNTKRTSSVFFLRNRERSPLNYLIKILMSGVNSATGAKSNKKLTRQYKKELRQRNLPPVDYD